MILDILLGGLGVTLLGVMAKILITVGQHDKEHDVIHRELEEIRQQLAAHSEDINDNKVLTASITTSLDYITRKLDGIDAKIDSKADKSR